MAFRGYGSYRGDMGGEDSPDFSDVSGGSSTLSLDPTFTAMDPGTALALPNVDYGQIVQGIAGGGLGAGLPGIIGGIGQAISGWRNTGGSGGGSAGPGVGAGNMVPGASPGARARRGRSGYTQGTHLAHRQTDSWVVRDSRRMNPANSKALRRSLRRLKAFEHMAKSVYSFTHRAKGKPHFKFHRRRRR
jgi:hypothetical protein